MAVEIPFINGVQYSWAQVTIKLLSGVVFGVTKIMYKEEQEMENSFGSGTLPYGRGFGKITPTASITMFMDEIEKIQAIAQDGRIQNIPEFDVTVSYIPVPGKAPVRHVIKNCRFKTNGREISSGDMKVEQELELLPSHIQWK